MRGCPLIRVCSLIRSNTVSRIWLNLILNNLVRVVRLILDRCRACCSRSDQTGYGMFRRQCCSYNPRLADPTTLDTKCCRRLLCAFAPRIDTVCSAMFRQNRTAPSRTTPRRRRSAPRGAGGAAAGRTGRTPCDSATSCRCRPNRNCQITVRALTRGATPVGTVEAPHT